MSAVPHQEGPWESKGPICLAAAIVRNRMDRGRYPHLPYISAPSQPFQRQAATTAFVLRMYKEKRTGKG
ncbi:hypothetical protein J31TS4_30040 [Paenibacillus sp. J31TS4]|nr:hypothetical protein J31TS4_30040 [Paenibacillus sp. J31TS4]